MLSRIGKLAALVVVISGAALGRPAIAEAREECTQEEWDLGYCGIGGSICWFDPVLGYSCATGATCTITHPGGIRTINFNYYCVYQGWEECISTNPC